MPITVQYGATEKSNAGQILAQSGLANLAREQQSRLDADRLRQQRDMQLIQIDAQANQQREAAQAGMASDAMRFNFNQQLQESAREQTSDNAIREAEYTQQLKEQGFDYEYTLGQRQEIAQWDNTLQRIDSSDDLNDEEKLIARRQVLKKKSGIEKTVLPADPDAMKFPENQAQSLQETWKDEDGNIMAYSAKGEPIVRQDYKDTKPGIQAKQEYDRQQEETKWISDLSTKLIDDGEGGKRTMEPKEIADTIFTAESAKEELERMRVEKQQQQERQQQELIESSARIFGMRDQQPQQQEDPTGFIGLAEQLGVQPNEKEQRLPGDIGAMFAILRTVDERYTDEDGKINLSQAPPELIQNLEIMEQRAASWLANEQLDRNRKPIPKKKGLKRSTVGGFMGGTMVGQF